MDTPENLKQIKVKLVHNVSFNVYDEVSHKLISKHEGHNMATNSMLTGVAHYLTGDGVLNQAWDLLRQWVPQYISLGTMGLRSQEEDEFGYPAEIGQVVTSSDEEQCVSYMEHIPGFGADGYDSTNNNKRPYFGLGPIFTDRPDQTKTIDCELITNTFPRSKITYREIVPENKAEIPGTIDVVLSAIIPVGAFDHCRESDKDYIFITEAGLWAKPLWEDTKDNGLLAGYRMAPPNEDDWDMTKPHNRQLLKESILRVEPNQIVQVIWKIQLGSITEYGGEDVIYNALKWIEWTEESEWGEPQKWPDWCGPNDDSPHNNVLKWTIFS